eukprot:1281111-Prymnesium_polylepis.2
MVGGDVPDARRKSLRDGGTRARLTWYTCRPNEVSIHAINPNIHATKTTKQDNQRHQKAFKIENVGLRASSAPT